MTETTSPQQQPTNHPETEGAREILRALRRILRVVDLHGRRLAQQHGLSGPQLLCLREIRRNGPLNPGQLARSVSLSPATITGILDRLEGRALVSRRRRNRDKRQVLVELTDQGAALLGQVAPPLQERFVERLAELDPADRERIAASLEQVVTLMDAEDLDAAPLLASGAATVAHPAQGVPAPSARDPGLKTSSR